MIKSITIKTIISFIATILLVNVFYIPASHAIGQIMGEGKSFLEASNGENSVVSTSVLRDTSNYIYNTLLAMAIIIAVIVAMILGIQFMVAAADEKAKIKEALMPFIAGCAVVFGSFTIWKVFVNIGNSAESAITAVEISKNVEDYNDDDDKVENEENIDFNNWYDYIQKNIGMIIVYEEEEKARNWTKEEWRGFWNYMMETFGNAGGIDFHTHLKWYIENKYTRINKDCYCNNIIFIVIALILRLVLANIL